MMRRRTLRRLLLAAALLALGAAAASAELPISEAGPVPVPEPDAKALAYYRSGNVLWWCGQAFDVAFPLLLEKPVSMLTAVGVSVRAVSANLAVMLLWGLVVAALLLAGAALFLIGLAAVLPILGHATWHLYRRLVIN